MISTICARAPRQQLRERNLAEFAAQRGTHELRQLRARLIEAAQRLVEAQGIDDAVARVGLHLEPLLVAQDHLLRRRLQQQQARVVGEHAVDERRLPFQAGLGLDADRRAQPDDQRLLALRDDEQRRNGEIEREAGDDQNRPNRARAHLTSPVGRRPRAALDGRGRRDESGSARPLRGGVYRETGRDSVSGI